jgi:hypothetical protein
MEVKGGGLLLDYSGKRGTCQGRRTTLGQQVNAVLR